MDIKLKITDPNNNVIEFLPVGAKSLTHIRSVDINFDTRMGEDEPQKKSKDMQANVEIEGDIDSSINKQMKELSDWARDFDAETTYRRVDIEIDDESAKTKYILPKMFVTNFNYQNSSDKKSNRAVFKLKLMQREDALAEIWVESN